MGEQQAQLISHLLPDGTLIFVNEAYCSFFAKKREELIGHSFMPLILKEDQGKMQQSISSLGKENPIAIHDYRFLADNGQIRWLQWANHATFDKEGALTELLAVGQDITERKQAEEELRRSEEKYRSLVHNIPDVAWTSDENYNIIFISPNVERLTGYTQEEEYQVDDWMKWYERVHPDDMEYAKTAFKEFIQGRKPYDIDYRFQRKDRQWIWIHDRSVETYEKDGKLFADGLIADITERKQAEEELRRSEEKYRSLISNIPDVAWTSDKHYNIVFVSPTVERITGYTQAEEYKMGDWMAWYERVHPDDVEEAKAAFQELMGGKKHYDIEYRFQRKDGQWIWIHDRSVGTYERDGKLYADGLITDITQRRQVEEERKELEERAQLNSRLACIGQMASGIAHEINNPLTSIIGLTETMMQKGLPENIREHMEIVNDGAQRIAAIVSRLLAFAQPQRPERTYVDINEVVQTTLALRSYALETANIKVNFQLASDLPRAMADAGQLQQVFLNIILNAEFEMKSAHGKGNLLIRTEKIDNAIRISFKDDGHGILKKNLDKVFDPFFTTKPVGQGTGLGLSVCHGIIAEHNGQVYAMSQLGKGATFTVELPVITGEESDI